MSGRLAAALCELAVRILPGRRRDWGEAMKAELAHVDAGGPALAHGGGCLVAAAKARAQDFDTRFAAGLWSVALVTAGFAAFHLQCAARGIAALNGGRDGFLEALLRGGADADLVASYRSAMPAVIACFIALGLVHAVAAVLLARRRLDLFPVAWTAALAIAAAAVAIQLSVVWTPVGLPTEFQALLVQAAALPPLLLWSRGRHRTGRRRE